ncbi:hypothetical protein [Fusobacterium sp.]|uniref:hypothetical protein n=1 Tax=Fusobacterium sp. TaxID=68766 RepID=UPI0029024BDA|nr:hypothetical protein [Fusobacterium sp.]MDU1911290.1 hypothetical protein [Fusobacterium sp.]
MNFLKWKNKKNGGTADEAVQELKYTAKVFFKTVKKIYSILIWIKANSPNFQH